MEVDVLMKLKWKLNFLSVYYWLGFYLELLRPCLASPSIEMIRIAVMNIIDIAVHCPGFLAFPYSLLSAAALHLRLGDGKITPIGILSHIL